MPARKHITKEMCLDAMDKTKSIRAASRYLNVSYQHLKPYMKMYKDEKTGKSLFDLHFNQMGKGIPKFLGGKNENNYKLIDILEGRIDISNFNPERIKYRLIEEGYLKEECAKCGMDERRVLDYIIPLILHFIDGNKKNYKPSNLELCCYNCYFLQVGNVFTKEDINSLEDYIPISKTTPKVELEITDYHKERLKELGLYPNVENEDFDNSGEEFISRV